MEAGLARDVITVLVKWLWVTLPVQGDLPQPFWDPWMCTDPRQTEL